MANQTRNLNRVQDLLVEIEVEAACAHKLLKTQPYFTSELVRHVLAIADRLTPLYKGLQNLPEKEDEARKLLEFKAFKKEAHRWKDDD